MQRIIGITLLLAAAGCQAPRLTESVPDMARGFQPHLEQVLDNVAAYVGDPWAWPSHVLVHKGSFESRRHWNGSFGTDTFLQENTYGLVHWDMTAMEDPYDTQRVRLLYQWLVGFLPFEELEKRWNEIPDRNAEDGPAGSRPGFQPRALPISRDSRRDWFASGPVAAPGSLSGRQGLKVVWITDPEGASRFAMAVLAAMVNTRAKAR